MKSHYLLILVIISCVYISCERKESRIKTEKDLIQHNPPNRADTLILLLTKADMENRKVFLVLGFHACGGCKLFERYHRDTLVKSILDKYFIVSYIDYYATRGGKELYSKYASIAAPSWSIFDSKGHVLINSDAPVRGVKDEKANIGYPVGKYEIDYYLHALKMSAPAMEESECKLLANKLLEYKSN